MLFRFEYKTINMLICLCVRERYGGKSLVSQLYIPIIYM